MSDLSQAVVLSESQTVDDEVHVTCIVSNETSLDVARFVRTLPGCTTVQDLYKDIARTSKIASDTFLLVVSQTVGQDITETIIDSSSQEKLVSIAISKRVRLIIKPKQDVEAVFSSSESESASSNNGAIVGWKSGASSSGSGVGASSSTATGTGMSYSAAASKAAGRSDYAGLVNQAMTCYLNSVLQTQFMTPEFRNAIYTWQFSGGPDEESTSIPFQLQKLFATMQTTRKRAIKTVDVTKSFGWTTADSWQQHDVQELCRVMFDALEKTFKGTAQEMLIKQLYEGRMQDYVKCLACGHESTRSDTYMDISLVIKPFGATKACGSVEEALKVHVTPETLDGCNQYFCEKCDSKQDAHKGLKFLSFPYLLTLQLKRFDFDYQTMHRIKLNNRMTFPSELNLNGFIANEGDDCKVVRRESISLGTPVDKDSHFPQRPETSTSDAGTPSGLSSVCGEVSAVDNEVDGGHGDDNALEGDKNDPDYVYELLSIMVHSGSAIGGHYYAYIRSVETNKWYSFNDSNVSPITHEDIKKTFGGSTSTGSYTSMYSSSANAYMLIYRRIDHKRRVNFMAVEEFPPHVARLVKAVEDYEELERQKVEIERCHCRIPVFYRKKVEDVPVSKILDAKNDTPLIDVVDMARQLHGLDDIPLERCRLAKYDEHYDACEFSYDDRDNEQFGVVLGGTRQSYFFELLLETREEDEEFERYAPNSTTLKVHEVDLEAETVSKGFRTVRLPLSSTLQQVRQRLESQLGYTAASCRIVVQRYGSDVALLHASLTLSEEGFHRAAVVFAEYRTGRADDVPFRSSKLYKVVSRHVNTIKWSVTLPPEPNAESGDAAASDATQATASDAATSGQPRIIIVEFDRRATIAEFKKHLEQYLYGTTSDNFRLYKTLKNGQDLEVTRLSEPLTYHSDSPMKVVLGRALGVDEHRASVWLFEPNKDIFMSSLGEVVIRKGMNVPALQAEVLQLCKSIVKTSANEAQREHASAVLDAPPGHLRLRRKNYRTPTNVLAGKVTIGREIAIYNGWEMSVEILEAPETYNDSTTAIFVRRWNPSNHTFGKIQEILVPDSAVKTTKAAIARLSNLPVDQIDIAKANGSFPYRHSLLNMDTLQWNPAVSYIDRMPVSILNDSCMLFYRDIKEEAEVLTPERRLEIGKQELARRNQMNRVAAPSHRKEHALKIKTSN